MGAPSLLLRALVPGRCLKRFGGRPLWYPAPASSRPQNRKDDLHLVFRSQESDFVGDSCGEQ